MTVKHLIETMHMNRTVVGNGILVENGILKPDKARVAVLISGTGEHLKLETFSSLPSSEAC